MPLGLIVLLAAMLPGLLPQQPASSPGTSLDFEVYRASVEPLFLKPRAEDEGSGNACFLCHTKMATRMRLQPLPPGATAWTEEQSRLNFAVVSRLVTPGDPLKSALLLHPLASQAGGDPQHTGGKFWKSVDNPDWQTIAAWVRAASAPSVAASPATPTLDFQFFRDRVQPILLAPRGEHARCVACHGPPLGLVRLKPGVTSWTEEESRKNFASLWRLVAPGDPLSSRLLMHPLAPAAGGDPFHTGGKHWLSQDDPEWQILAAWVRGETAKGQK